MNRELTVFSLPMCHDPLQPRLARLNDPRFVIDLIERWRAETGQPAAGEAWTRHYARAQASDTGWVTLVYSNTSIPSELVVIVGLHEADGADLVDAEVGPVALRRFPDDPALPGLPAVLSSLRDPCVVRYRFGKRCTMRGVTPSGPRFVKVVGAAGAIHADMVSLWEASGSADVAFRVAEPMGWDQEHAAVWQSVVAGRPIISDVVGPDGATWCHRLGAALGSLAVSGVAPNATTTGADQLERTRRAATRTARLFPWLAERLDRLLERLEAAHHDLAPRTRVPIHGAPHVHQWLDDRGTLGLIDFDRFALGDPELDLATFVAELETERTRTLSVADLQRAIVSGFETIGGPIDLRRLEWYVLQKRVSKVARTAWAVRADRAERTEAHLRRLETALDT